MAKKKKSIPTHIMCILDRSGSMSHLATDVIGSFNTFLNEQKSLDGEAFMTLVLFDNEYEVVYDKINLKDVKEIDSKIYFTRGMTALYDAVGKTIASNTDEKAIVLIQTDGAENSSKEYTKDSVKKLVEEKEKAGWKFIFVGANIDAASESAAIGIAKNCSVQFEANSAGLRSAYCSMSFATSDYRSN